ncbi:MAG: hypothetical protein QOD62_235 [Actinomycetota bacterium]|nr:hypothetical protein [Actinomycetota bacterium]
MTRTTKGGDMNTDLTQLGTPVPADTMRKTALIAGGL